MKSLKIIRNILHSQFLTVRNFNNLIQSDDFQIAYEMGSNDEREAILIAIGHSDKDAIKTFINNKISEGTPFEQLSIRKLRVIGRHLKIVNYNILNKQTLIEEINHVATTLKDDSKRKHIQSEQSREPSRQDFVRCGNNLILGHEGSRAY